MKKYNFSPVITLINHDRGDEESIMIKFEWQISMTIWMTNTNSWCLKCVFIFKHKQSKLYVCLYHYVILGKCTMYWVLYSMYCVQMYYVLNTTDTSSHNLKYNRSSLYAKKYNESTWIIKHERNINGATFGRKTVSWSREKS